MTLRGSMCGFASRSVETQVLRLYTGPAMRRDATLASPPSAKQTRAKHFYTPTIAVLTSQRRLA